MKTFTDINESVSSQQVYSGSSWMLAASLTAAGCDAGSSVRSARECSGADHLPGTQFCSADPGLVEWGVRQFYDVLCHHM